MTPERYKRINALADAALDLPPADRDIFLDRECGVDTELRERVAQLLQAHSSHDDFLQTPVLEVLAKDFVRESSSADITGRLIHRYRVVSRLGSGGIGEVWLASDTQLKRDIALKLLSAKYAGDPSHVLRLEREARAASSLNHPNIVTIFEVGEADGTHFIAQELVNGETLRQRLKYGPLPVKSVAEIGSQVAAALGAAHQAGIVHRDIKPENIMIRPDGLVKVLDFGLARFVENESGQHGDTLRNYSITRPGLVVGTVRYMSPEQARGLRVNSRSDIFSLGVVLYEMASGTAPFSGPTPTDVMAAILTRDPPPLSNYSPQTSPDLERIVKRCLTKNAEDRYASATELCQELKRLAHEDAPPLRSTRNRWMVVAALAAIVVGLSVYAFVSWNRAAAPVTPLQVTRLVTRAAPSDPVISPDGKYVAYVVDEPSGQSVWRTQIASSADDRLVSPEPGRHTDFTFSPDGSSLFYRKTDANEIGALYRLPLNGGPPVKVMDGVSDVIAFAPGGKQFGFVHVDPTQRETTLTIANVDGSGQRQIVTRRHPGYLSRYGLAWSPDGKWIACFAGNATGYTNRAFHLVKIRVADGKEESMSDRAWRWAGSMVWAASGKSIFFSGTEHMEDAYQVWSVSIPGGEVSKLTNDLSNYSRLSLTADSKTLLALQTQRFADIWIHSAANSARATQITFGSVHSLESMAWTPDGRIVYTAPDGQDRNIWVLDSGGHNIKQLTFSHGDKNELAITRDGRYMLYQSEGNIWRADLDGANALQLTRGPMDVHPASSADGQEVVFASFLDWSPGTAGKPTLWRVPIDGGKPLPVTQDPASIPQVSPDGKLIACEYFPGAEPQLSKRMVAVMNYKDGSIRAMIEQWPFGFSHVLWEPEGRVLTFILNSGEAGNIWREPLTGGPPSRLTDFNTDEIFAYAWSKDGRLASSRGKRVRDVVLVKGFKN